jgi:hypothetical protein
VPKFHKVPLTIEARQFTIDDASSLAEWCGGEYVQVSTADDTELVDQIRVPTLEGVMVAYEGDWIIRGIRDEFYPCRGDIFYETYVPAADEDNDDEDNEDLVESLIAMSEIIDQSRGIASVLMLSGSMFSEAATEIQRLRQQLKQSSS